MVQMEIKELQAFNKTFEDFMKTSKRSIRVEIFYKARDVAFKAYFAFKKFSLLAKNPSFRKVEVFGSSLGWKVKYPVSINEGKNTATARLQYRIEKNASVAKAWLPAAKFLRQIKLGKNTEPSVNFDSGLSAVKSSGSGDLFSMLIQNRHKGSTPLNAKYNAVAIALNGVRQDMEKKIKQRLEREGKIYLQK